MGIWEIISVVAVMTLMIGGLWLGSALIVKSFRDRSVRRDQRIERLQQRVDELERQHAS